MTGLRNSPKIVLVKLKAKKNANTVTEVRQGKLAYAAPYLQQRYRRTYLFLKA
jgi:hypothetical protein